MATHTITIDLPEPLYRQLSERSQQLQRSVEEELLALLIRKIPSSETLEKMPLAYTEVVEFLGSGATTQEISEFRLSPQTQAQAQNLLRKNKENTLTPAEEAELDLYIELENFMSLIKMRALQQLQNRL